jgi:O-antigen/teichoic acid export membrane protein
MGNFLIKRIREFSLTIDQRAFELVVNLIAMIIVERACGQGGLGVFSYLLSLYFIAGYISEFGVPDYLESETAISYGNRTGQFTAFTNAFGAAVLLSALTAGFFVLFAAYSTSHTFVEEKVAGYIAVGLALVFRNLNGIKLAHLNGLGHHGTAAGLKIEKRCVFLFAVFVLATMFPFFRKNPSYLVLAFLISELVLFVRMKKKVTRPSIKVEK